MTASCVRANLGLLVGLVALALLGSCASTTANGVSTVEPDAAASLLADRDDVTVIDVRTPEEFAEGHLADAQLLDLTGGEFEARVGDLDRDAAYLLYCRTGNRSGQAAAMMDELGFTEVYDAGGYDSLAAAGAPTGG